ncbi:alpha/beta hydrolase [Paenibacillus mucilaginosus]|uniref:Esterase n=2 Tax=Paenibacillus mucilaginosus TaxID=61624 RepID=H6N982_9BACL|nr:alpha/beta hydrolase family protein [Paenibacillus mucilaginosus]AEI39583.1 esterase [Paenibacillus mucilaginosus KNP414]AFC27828.1 esterase [Paenibacillus mucilaginosus 3016]MCG7214608.1 esterase family protein [Paenibacillus mucilaginosus]WDM28530.1 esterase family protein [Paenibacillus mucilaginosus]WFA16697.1 esterase family protein [Paenibacillus mucilaginosus]
MAFIDCHFFSDTLGISSSMYVILPQAAQGQIGMDAVGRNGRHPVLFLLHGLSDDHTIWMRRTSIERYAASLGLAVVMPNVHRSFYTDMAQGGRYFTFVSEELPALARSFFPLAEEAERTFVAGLSMGGYGAMKLALTRPDRFGAAASLSGALDAEDCARTLLVPEETARIFGSADAVPGSGSDLFHLASRLAASGGPRPKLYQCCGTEDFLYGSNIRFRDHCRTLGIELTYEEEPGTHEWGYWDRKIQSVLGWLPL